MAKRLEFMRDVAPGARTVALLMNPDNLNYEVDVKAAQDAARGLDRQTFAVQARNPAEIDAAKADVTAKTATREEAQKQFTLRKEQLTQF